MLCGQLPPISARMRAAVEAFTIRLHESNRAIVEHLRVTRFDIFVSPPLAQCLMW